jgi:hypothetical protein
LENRNSSPLIAILGILTAIWLLVLAGTVIIFGYIVPFAYFHNFLDSILKGTFSTILVLVWLGIFIGLTNSFVGRFIIKKS